MFGIIFIRINLNVLEKNLFIIYNNINNKTKTMSYGKDFLIKIKYELERLINNKKINKI